MPDASAHSTAPPPRRSAAPDGPDCSGPRLEARRAADRQGPAGILTNRGAVMETLWRDVRYGVRSWWRTPGFTLIVVLTLAIGIGANTTAFSVINTLFLNPLPVDRPSELVTLGAIDEGTASAHASPVSYLNLNDIRERNTVFASLAGHSAPTVLTLLNSNAPQRLFGELVTGNYFDTVGVRPSRGRFFLPQEDSTLGAAPVLVLSHAAWQARFGRADDIVGRQLRINGVMFTVIGVAPEGFKGINAVFGPDVWIPTMMVETILPAQAKDWLRSRATPSHRGVARLKAGAAFPRANAEVGTIAKALARDFPDDNRGRGLIVEPLTRAALIAPGTMSASTLSLLLMAIPLLMLVIACSNVANLLLARASSRRQEIALRLAIGSNRHRLVRQLLTESVLPALLSGILGFGLAYAGVQLLWSFRPSEVAANLIDLEIDLSVFAFALVLSLGTGVLVGLIPAWSSTRGDLVRDLNDGSRAVGPGRGRLTVGRALMSGQVALSLVALVTAGLLVRSLQQAYGVNPGFEKKHLAVAMLSPGQAGYNRLRSEQFYADARTAVAGIPGVVSASWATQLPLFARPSRRIAIEGRDNPDRSTEITSIVNATDVDYFSTIGTAITRGRDFLENDRDGTLPVAIVNETLAARAWPGLDPVGRRFRLVGESMHRQVVGVAKTANYGGLGEAPQPGLFLPIRQQFSDAAVLYVRTQSEPASVLSTVQSAIRRIDSTIDASDVRTIETVISQSLFGATIGVGLLTVFGFISLGLASLGLYGATAYAVRERRGEIGMRMALGAQRAQVLNLVLRQGLSPVGIGVALGSAIAIGVGRLLSDVLFGITPADPVSLIGASAILAAVASFACYLPARMASRLDPLVVLREH
jgi:predicted permease